jgi:ABC-type Zn uptake system ZnuABC Zn-binding protein ZnuA
VPIAHVEKGCWNNYLAKTVCNWAAGDKAAGDNLAGDVAGKGSAVELSRTYLGLAYGLSALLWLAGCELGRNQPHRNADTAGEGGAAQAAPLAVSSPYLEAAVREVLQREVPLVRLAGPAMCPGHFDMRPSQIADLARCRLLVRFDFQQAIDEKLRSRSGAVPHTLAVTAPNGLCVPESYLSACRQIADHFVAAGEMSAEEAQNRLNQLAERLAKLEAAVGGKIDKAGLRGASVLASGHQAAFCRWLGLRVVGTFSGADTVGLREIEQAAKAGGAAQVALVIANEPEGRRLADALADRLGARVVVFGNFPAAEQPRAFDALVQRNLAALLAALPAREPRP